MIQPASVLTRRPGTSVNGMPRSTAAARAGITASPSPRQMASMHGTSRGAEKAAAACPPTRIKAAGLARRTSRAVAITWSYSRACRQEIPTSRGRAFPDPRSRARPEPQVRKRYLMPERPAAPRQCTGVRAVPPGKRDQGRSGHCPDEGAEAVCPLCGSPSVIRC